MAPSPASPLDVAAEARRATRSRWAIWACLALAGLLRLWIVAAGGQGFWSDENRYSASVDAAANLAEGRLREALTVPVGQGDHVGFKLLMIGPALAARWTGIGDPRLPAGFLAVFSWAVVWLGWGLARRLDFSPAAQAWAVALAAASGSLLVYARHLLPYDASLALALAALYVGWKKDGGLGRAFVAGLLAGAAFLIYFGYWLVVGAVLGLLGLRAGLSGMQRLGRWAAAGLGAATVLLAVWLIDRWGAGTLLANARSFSTTVSQGDFGRGYQVVTEYFWHAEGGLALLFATAVLVVVWRWRQARAEVSAPAEAWLLVAVAVLGLGGGLIAASDGLRKFVVYGRTARELTPFLCLAGGLFLAETLARRPAVVGRGVAALVAVAAAWNLAAPLTQEFPSHFRRRAAPVLAAATPAEPGRSFYRFVNVEHYIFDAEAPAERVRRTLLAARHPYQYEPYLYEGFSAAQRARRRAVDHRMRLIEAEVPPERLVQGAAEGQVRLTVTFRAGRSGLSEPLLAIGRPGAGMLLFVRYVGERQAIFGVEIVDARVLLGEPVDCEPGREHTVDFYAGNLGGEADMGALGKFYYPGLLRVALDGREALSAAMEPGRYPRVTGNATLYAGVNLVRSGSALGEFSGAIREVRRGGLPPLPEGLAEGLGFGPLRMKVQLAGLATGRAEPLIVAGEPGRAQLAYVRELAPGRIRVGIEIWGTGVVESEPLDVPAGAPLELEWRFPALYPAAADARWTGVTAEERTATRRHFAVFVNGALAVEKDLDAPEVAGRELTLGRNPLGGSWVEAEFLGRILQVARARSDASH